MSWYVRKTSKPLTLDHTLYYSFEKKEVQNQTNKKSTQEKNQNTPQKQESQKQTKKRKETPSSDNEKPTKKQKTTAITEASFI